MPTDTNADVANEVARPVEARFSDQRIWEPIIPRATWSDGTSQTRSSRRRDEFCDKVSGFAPYSLDTNIKKFLKETGQIPENTLIGFPDR